MALVKGICGVCGKPIMGTGYCGPCANEIYRKIDEEFPFEVIDGDGRHLESFKTEKEAEQFVDCMKGCYSQKNSQ
jgi:hypothetical protein